MADFLWSALKENSDSPLALDREGLQLAFKYFCSTTLTMRLCGINQVNAHISLFNELCNSESVGEVEQAGLQLAQWILDSGLVEHIFWPNLHVEVIKQSHVILNFLAMEGKLSSAHMDAIWQAAQMKYCSKQVHDLLPPLIKNLEAGPVLHLYELVQRLPVKEHTEQTIYLAQVRPGQLFKTPSFPFVRCCRSSYGPVVAPSATCFTRQEDLELRGRRATPSLPPRRQRRRRLVTERAPMTTIYLTTSLLIWQTSTMTTMTSTSSLMWMTRTKMRTTRMTWLHRRAMGNLEDGGEAQHEGPN